MTRLCVFSGGAETDITGMVPTTRWGGGYNQCARTLDFALLNSAADSHIPSVGCDLGTMVRLYNDDALLFEGYVVSRQSDTGSHLLDIGCFDRGFYLKRNEAVYSFPGTTPEDMTRRVAADFDIPVGALAATGVKITRDFPGVSLYKIVQTGYTLASVTTGGRYMVRFRGPRLEVVEKKVGPDTLRIRAGSNLISATMTESYETMVNRVEIYDDKQRKIGTREDASLIALYGLLQKQIAQRKGVDSAAEAQQILDDNGVAQKITVEVMGNPELISGNCVAMEEPVTGLYGLFWIDSDAHSWNKDGTYTAKLVLNFRNIMDKVEAGKLKEA